MEYINASTGNVAYFPTFSKQAINAAISMLHHELHDTSNVYST